MSLDILKSRLDEYLSLQKLLKDSPNKITRHGVVTIYMGDNYFVDLEPEKAANFLQRRIDVLQQEVDTIQHLNGINEEGLPIMEIVEELDDDDNVVNSRVDRAAGALEHLRSAVESRPEKPEIEAPAKESAEPAEKAKSVPVESAQPSQSAQPPQSEPRITEITEEEPEMTYNGISKDDMLELQLVQDEFDFDDEDDMSVDLNDLDMDDDDDDDDEYEPLRGSLFPQTSRVREMLAKQFPVLQNERKEVRFAESLDVREFETSSDERKGIVEDTKADEPEPEPSQPKQLKVSQFKLRRGGSAVPAAASSGPRVASTIVEKTSEVPETPRVASVVAEKTPAKVSEPMPPKPVESRSTYSRRYKIPASRPAAVPLAAPKTAPPDPAYEGIGYIRDEDDASRKELEDEALQLFDQSTIPDEDFLALHGDDAGDDVQVQTNTDRPILSDVAERDNFEPLEDDVEKHNDMLEIRQEYQRLRQKLVHRAGGYGRTDKDMEVEPVDEAGNPVKVSRFKAARIGMR